ncbi:ABC transporter ATP-binding protein/permease [Rhizobium leguminosarum bv. viciae]|nr:ABC transporter ATP-binding protein/permease [Rhizobium leguminosarum bv. viciae]
MDTQLIPFKVTAARFGRAVRVFMTSEVGSKAGMMFAGLVVLSLALSGLNVVNSYVGRNFMTAIANRETAEFIRQAMFYIGVFAAFTVVAVVARFTEERLALLWREFLTRRAINLYLADGTYYRLDVSGQLTHPDQRIAEDMRAFTVTTLSFILMVLNSGLTIVAFSGVLWSISPLLFVVAIVYAACGSYLTIALGRPLIKLNYDQLDKEASFRSGLIQVRENAESIMLARYEEQQTFRLSQRLEEVVANFRKITAINRNVGFFTTGYNWLIQIIPALIVAPAYIRGDIDFGVITQSGAAFAMLVGACSLIITQFQSLSTFAAVVARLSSLMEAIEQAQRTVGSDIEIVEEKGRLAYERLVLLSSANGHPIVKDLSLSIPVGTRVLITGPAEAARVALFKATAGVSFKGSGRIIRPGSGDILFLPQRPYLPASTLRQILVRHERTSEISDERIIQLLRELNLEQVVEQAGGLHIEKDWEMLLSLEQQQLLVLVNILLAAPGFAFVDRIDTTLGLKQLRKIMEMLSENSITVINNAETDALRDCCDAVLECGEDGGWTWTVNRA